MARRLARGVDIIGVGMTPLGFVSETPGLQNLSARELWVWAAGEAMEDAGVGVGDVDAFYLANMIGEYAEDQYHLNNVVAQWTGLGCGDGVWKGGVRVEGACASSSHAIRQAAFAVASGACDVVMAGGAEVNNAHFGARSPGEARKMTNEERLASIYCHYDQAWEMPQLAIQDMVLIQWLIAYAKEYGLDAGTLTDVLDARVLANNHNGCRNPRAYWTRPLEEVSAEAGFGDPREFLRSPKHNPVSYWPARLWDGPRRCDGAAVVILCAAEVAGRFRGKPVHVLGSGNAHGTSISEKMHTQPFIVEAARQAYEMAGLSPECVDLVEMYDFAPAEYLIPLEDVGYLPRGKGWKAVLDGRTRCEGDRPVNTGGGATAGLVVGAVGAIGTYHLVRQLRGEAGATQVDPTPRTGLLFDCGAARDAVIHLYGR